MSPGLILLILVALGFSETCDASAGHPRRGVRGATVFFVRDLRRSEFEAFAARAAFDTVGHLAGGSGDVALDASEFSTGCTGAAAKGRIAMTSGNQDLSTIAESFAEDGRSVGLITTKCATDVSALPFWMHARVGYDLDDVQRRLERRYPFPSVLFGGTSRSTVPEALPEQVCHATDWASARACPDGAPVFGEFGNASSAYAMRCAYVAPAGSRVPSLGDLTAEALRRLSANTLGHLLVVLDESVSRARKDPALHALELRELDETIAASRRSSSNSIVMVVGVSGRPESDGFVALAWTSESARAVVAAGALPETVAEAGGLLRAGGTGCSVSRHFFVSESRHVSAQDTAAWATMGFVAAMLALSLLYWGGGRGRAGRSAAIAALPADASRAIRTDTAPVRWRSGSSAPPSTRLGAGPAAASSGSMAFARPKSIALNL